MSEYAYKVDGRIEADSADEAHRRLERVMRVLGFADIGDGSLWLNRPRDAKDDVGMALGELTIYIDGIEVLEV